MSCSEKSLTINIDTEYVVCPREGGIIKIENTYSGFLICPDYNLICTGTGTVTGNEICNNIFDCVDNKISYKDSTFTYDYTQSEYVSSEITNCDDKSITNYATDVYELGDGGICPKYCSQCSEKGQCKECAGNYTIYIGNKEGDDEPINCTDKIPEHGYYHHKSQDGKNYYYRCIDFCYVCFEDKKEECYQCAPTHKLTNGSQCEPRIPGCIGYDTSKTINDTTSNNGYPSYNECLSCDNENKYFCFNMDRTKCEEDKTINKTLYYDMEDKSNPCIQKCENRFMNCESCNNNTCTSCYNQSNHFINDFGDCIPKIENCQVHNKSLNTSSCEICKENESYYCVNDNRTYCEYISSSSISSYSKTNNNQNSCYQLCNITFGNECLECQYNSCTKCIKGYFVGYDGQCYKNLTGCINNKLINPDTLSIECDECDNSSNYYCINQTRTECTNIAEKGINISYYYKYSDISYPCYGLCEERIKNCIRCDSKYCIECSGNFTVNRKRTNCSYFSNYFRDDEKCQIKSYPNPDYENLIKSLNFDDLISDYFENLEHISKVEHYVGKDYLMTLYINSSCTDGLLSEGYYSIDSRELNNTIIDSTEGVNYHLFGVYINHNYRSYLKFYELDTGKEPINFNTDCPNCIGKNYYMTHNLYYILKDIIGTPFTEIVIEREIDIFDPNSDIYTDRCTNLTLYEIDVPLHIRKNYLLLDEFNIDALMCRDMDCEIIDYNFKNRTAKCQCPVRRNTKFEYLFEKNDIKYTLSTIKEKAKGISEAAKAISCTKEGLKYSNFKNNDAAILILVFFIIQIVCYVAYGCFGKPLANISNLPSIHTLANPPKLEDNSRIYLFADWNTNLSNISKKQEEPIDEQEKVIQPRDDSGDQIMEEEKSFNNDFFSDISIDTNAGGLFPDKRTNRSLRALEKSKRVLILLGNKAKKTKKKVSIEHSLNQDEAVSDSDELPLSKRRKIDNSNFWKNYWLFLSIKQHIINYFSDLTCCEITISYIPLELRFVRSIFLFILSIIITILWLDQKYFEKKWEHFNDKYSLSTTFERDFEISLGERIGYALGTNFGYVIVNLIFLIVADFITGVIFFNLRSDVEKILDKGKMSKMQDYILKVRRNYNIFYAANFILIIIFFLSLCGFGVAYPGGVVDCLTVALFSVFFFEIVPFVWSLILAALRYYGYKKKKQNMIKFSEYFLY